MWLVAFFRQNSPPVSKVHKDCLPILFGKLKQDCELAQVILKTTTCKILDVQYLHECFLFCLNCCHQFADGFSTVIYRFRIRIALNKTFYF